MLAKHALSQLSYSPALKKMVGLERFELSTSRLSSARSNQLSYKPALATTTMNSGGCCCFLPLEKGCDDGGPADHVRWTSGILILSPDVKGFSEEKPDQTSGSLERR